jgi:methyltransferase
MRPVAVLAVVFVLMAGEAILSRRHERRLRAGGAIEPRDDVYGRMQVVYPLAFLIPAVEGWTRGDSPIAWSMLGLSIFVGAKVLKYWAIATLGERWTFKVLVPPGSERIRRGPYRVLPHPNYVAVAGEILGAGLLIGGFATGILFTILFGYLMLRRIQVEERALS